MKEATGKGLIRLTDLGLDLRYGIRTLRRTPGFTLVAVMTLALGIGAATAMFSVLDTALGRSLPFPSSERLVLGRSTFSGNLGPWVSFPDYLDYRDRSETLESLATIRCFPDWSPSQARANHSRPASPRPPATSSQPLA